ncbi:phosphatase domain-containing protein [Deinococcus lacus]|uniref:Phosphatase domain-containing protein n=1 Tax=Deinococcus lacus TaxID=392561 RepID=A0ABW1YET2_9DEIO
MRLLTALLTASLWSGVAAAELIPIDQPGPSIRVRVVEEAYAVAETPGDGTLVNLARQVSWIFPVPLPGSPVTCQAEEQMLEVRSDWRGYAECRFEQAPDGLVTVTQGKDHLELSSAAWLKAAHLTVSDLDDTVIRWSPPGQDALHNVLLQNSTTRLLYPDVLPLLRESAGQGPVLYLSASPEGLRLSLSRLLERGGFPQGPLLLRDVLTPPEQHKMQALEQLAEFSGATFTLLGDTTQQDPEIYAAFARRHPGRVSHVFIRDVSGRQRWFETSQLLEAAGVAYTRLDSSLPLPAGTNP